MPDIMFIIKIHVPPERAYDAITTADGIRQWWTRDAAIEPRLDAVGEFGFHGKRFVAKVAVEGLTPSTRVRWKVVNAAWPADDIDFDLRGDGNDTNLLFAHRGFPYADDRLASATTRWGFYLLSLKRYLNRPGNAESGRLRGARLDGRGRLDSSPGAEFKIFRHCPQRNIAADARVDMR